jgi:ribosomal protein S18 acetylase RimI-like enzyme
MKQTTKKRKSGRRAAASIKRKSNPTPDGELKNSTLQIENHERNEVFQKVVDYVNHQQYELPPSLVGFEFIQEPFCSCILTELKLCQRFWDTLNLCHADGSHIRLCTYKADELFISHIEVNEARRGLGIGTHMILFLLDLIEKACGSMIKVSLDVTRGGLDFATEEQDDLSDVRIRFFRRFGFRLNLRLSRYPSYYLMELDNVKYEHAKSKSLNKGDADITTLMDPISSRNSKLKLFDESTMNSLRQTVMGYMSDIGKLKNLVLMFEVPKNKILSIVVQHDNEIFYAIKATLIESADQLDWFDDIGSVINQPAINNFLSNDFEATLQFRNALDFSFNNGCQLRITTLGETIQITKIEVPNSIRRQGNGTKLVDMLFELANLAAYERPEISVLIDPDDEQEGLVEFFKKLGFAILTVGPDGSITMVANRQFESDKIEVTYEFSIKIF